MSHSDREHAKLSASSAHRWLTCTKSVALEERFPNESSEFALEGTAAHELAEIKALYATNRIPQQEYERRFKEFTENSSFFNPEMDECTDAYAKYVQSKAAEAAQTGELLAEAEVRLDFSDYVPEGFGTADMIIISDGVLEVIDFKYGKGVRVSAENNPQMMLYALGACSRYDVVFDFKAVRMTIFQPRLSSKPDTAEILVGNLLEWGEKTVKPRALLAYNGEGEYCPSEEACRFCRARFQCKARADKLLELFNTAPDKDLITPDEAGRILQNASDMEAWLKDLRTFVSNTLMNGEPVKNWKLVEGRSIRKFADEDLVVEAMTKAGFDQALLYERKLLSLSAMEKAFGAKAVKETLGSLIIKPQGAPTLAPETDSRPVYESREDIIKNFN